MLYYLIPLIAAMEILTANALAILITDDARLEAFAVLL